MEFFRHLVTFMRLVFRRMKNNVYEYSPSVSGTYEHPASPIDGQLVSVIIPTRDKVDLLKSAIDSLFAMNRDSLFELIVVDNGSKLAKTLDYLDELRRKPGITVLDHPGAFNYSNLMNHAANVARGEFLLLLNNDVVFLQEGSLRQMLSHFENPQIACVGSVLVYENSIVQHVGVCVGLRGAASHPFRGAGNIANLNKATAGSCFGVTAVTFATAMIPRRIYFELGGLSRKYPVGLNDVDFCMRAQQSGYQNVICRGSLLVHHESQSRRKMLSLTGGVQALADYWNISSDSSILKTERYFKLVKSRN